MVRNKKEKPPELVKDTTGLLGKKDREYEYDIFASNDMFFILC